CLAVLRLVLGEHLVDEALGQERIVRIDARLREPHAGTAPDLAEIREGLAPAAERQGGPRRARVADGGGHTIARLVADLGPRGAPADRPLLLEVGDVAEVPDDRAHERAVLLRKLLVVEWLDQLEGA